MRCLSKPPPSMCIFVCSPSPIVSGKLMQTMLQEADQSPRWMITGPAAWTAHALLDNKNANCHPTPLVEPRSSRHSVGATSAWCLVALERQITPTLFIGHQFVPTSHAPADDLRQAGGKWHCRAGWRPWPACMQPTPSPPLPRCGGRLAACWSTSRQPPLGAAASRTDGHRGWGGTGPGCGVAVQTQQPPGLPPAGHGSAPNVRRHAVAGTSCVQNKEYVVWSDASAMAVHPTGGTC